MSVQFEIGYHAELTKQANGGVLDDSELGLVVAANMAQDLWQGSSYIHFDNCDFSGGVDHIAAQWSLIEQAGDTHSEAALTAFGALLHTTQDFYAHSTWIELHLEDSPVPLWDQRLASLPPGIVSGVWWLGSPKMCAAGTPTHAQLNKDSPTSPEGQKVVGSGPNSGKSYFDLAFATALAASRAQFARFAAAQRERPRPQATAASAAEALELLVRANRRLRGGGC
jgi:hypothetical protein